MDTEELLSLSIEIAEALDTAHSQGIAHRDIKPGTSTNRELSNAWRKRQGNNCRTRISFRVGMLKHFDASRDIDRVEVPPTLDWSAQALSGAHQCMVRVVSSLGQTFAVVPEPDVATLEREWRYAWTDPR